MNEEQKNVMFALIAEAIEDDDEGGNNNMKHNLFDQETEQLICD